MLQKITLFVLSLHVGFLLLLTFSPHKKQIKPTQHLIVRTEKLSPPKEKQNFSPKTTTPPAPNPQKKEAPKKKAADPKLSAKKPAQKKENPAEKPKKPVKKEMPKPPKKQEVQKKEELLSKQEIKELEEVLGLIEGKQKTTSHKTPSIKEPSSFPSQEKEKAWEFDLSGSYQEELISHLHSSLNLPEYGDVSIELTLRSDGYVTKVVVLKAESVKNRKYLETHLPLLRFPPLQGGVEKEKTFKLTFSNEL